MLDAITKNILLKKYPVDESLTFKKAKERGYEWVEDLYFIDQYGVPAEIPELLRKKEYVLGRTHDDKDGNGVGLYRHIKK